MSAAPAIPCSTCETGSAAPYPFCPECGRRSPSFVKRGSFGVEIDEVPAEKLRGDLATRLRSWFPDVAVFDAKRQLESGRTLLLTGIDEESAHRMVETLKVMKAPARLVRVDAGQSWVENLWNPGLAVAAAVLLPAFFIRGIAGIVLALAAAAVPVAWAFVKGTARSPIVSVIPSEPDEDTVNLSFHYADVMNRLSEQDKKILMDLTTAVFDVQRRLQSESLASVAAGAGTGPLFIGLSEAVRTAVDIARQIPSADEKEQSRLRDELRSLGDLVTKTENWFRSIEGKGIKQPDALSEELQEITKSIDRILEDVRSPFAEHGRRGGKIRE